MTVNRRRAGRRAASALSVAALFAGGLFALPAAAAPVVAEPVYPSQEQVDGAKRAAADKATQIGAIESQLATASANLESMQVAAQMAAEDYNQAVVELEEATAAAAAARATADRALLDVEAARTAIGRLAATSYRSGSGLAGLEVFFSAGGPQELLDKAATIDALGDRRQNAYQRMDAAELVAQLLDEQARQAQQAQEDAAAAAEEARAEAQRSADAAAAEVERVAATRTDLIAQLAVLRDTSVELEQQRQDGLEAERRAREEAAARAEAERRERERVAAERAASNRAAADARDAEQRRAADRRAAEREAADRAARDDAPPAPAPAPAPPPPAPEPPSTPPGSSEGSSSAGRAAVAWARDQIGKPYRWGATGPDSFDCSGLTSQAWQKGGGVWITRTSRSQYRAVEKISYSQLRPGDLVFYGNGNDSSSIHHVAIYSGGGMMVEAARAGVPVRETSLRMSGTMDFAGRP